MKDLQHLFRNAPFADWPLALKSILGFWLFYALTIVARAFLGSDPATILQNKMPVVGAGMILTGLVYAAIALFGGATMRRKLVVAGLASAAARAFITRSASRVPHHDLAHTQTGPCGPA